jgi:hypothetical protein
MSFTRTLIIAASISYSLILAGCATKPEETWTNLGPSKIVTEGGRYVCYTDAQIIQGERTLFNLCATPNSGMMSDGEPQIWAGTGYRMPFKYLLSQAVKGDVVPLDGADNGQLKCEPLTHAAGSTAPETFCAVSVKGQVVVSAKVVFEGMKPLKASAAQAPR